MKKTALLLSALLLSAVPVPALAAIDAQGAAALKKLVEGELLWRVRLAKISGEGLSLGGEISVTPKADYYEVKLPDVAMTFAPQQWLELGAVTVNAVPGKSGEWMTSVALPQNLTLYQGARVPMATIALGKQRFAGAWVPEKGIFPRIDAEYRDVVVKLSDPALGNADIAIGSVHGTMNLKDNGDQTWSGQSLLEAEDIRYETPAPKALRLTVKKASTSNAFERLDTLRELEIRKKLQELDAAAPPSTPDETRAFINGLVSATQRALDNFSNTTVAEGLKLSLIGDPVEKLPPREFTLGKLSAQSSLRDARQEKATASFNGSFDGVKLPADSGDPVRMGALVGIVPQAVNLNVDIDNLPVPKVTALLYDYLQKALSPPKPGNPQPSTFPAPQGEQELVSEIFAATMKVMQEAGTSLSIRNTYSKSQDIEARADGKFTADPAAALGMNGKMTISFKGLEETFQKLQAAAAQPNADPALKSYTGWITVLMMMGQPEKGTDGTTVYTYSFDVKNDTRNPLGGLGLLPSMAPKPAPQQTPIPPAAPAPAPSAPAP